MAQIDIFVALATSVAAILGVLVMPRRRKRLALLEKGRTPSYHAVEVYCRTGNCPAAQAREGQRYLSSEAPGLPLPDCNNVACSCVYQHFEDRRCGERRDSFMAQFYTRSERSVERRNLRGRRRDDGA